MTWQESEHPRWPARAPGGRGGEFRGDWVQGVLLQMDITPEQEIRETLRDGKPVVRSVLAGGNSAETVVVDFTMPDGSTRKLVRKTSNAGDVRMETLASAIGRAIGAPVPAVVPDPDNDRRLWMPLLDGESPMEELRREYARDWANTAPGDEDEEIDYSEMWELDWVQEQEYELLHDPDYADSIEGRLLGLLDLMILNRDRHIGNWLILRDGTVAGIDHTHINVSTIVESEYGLTEHGPFTEPYLSASNERGLVNNDWHPADMELMGRALQALWEREDIQNLLDRMGSDPEVFLSRFRLVAARAKGTERRFE